MELVPPDCVKVPVPSAPPTISMPSMRKVAAVRGPLQIVEARAAVLAEGELVVSGRSRRTPGDLPASLGKSAVALEP